MTGEVIKPGIYPVFGSCGLREMISTAGGMTPRSGHIVNVTHHDQPDATIPVDLASTSVNDFEVYSGDTVTVTKAGVVYVLGDVARPAGLVMENNDRMTVLQALALAGGVGKDAGLKKARILRKSPQGIQQFPIPMKEILQAREQDMELLQEMCFSFPQAGVRKFCGGARTPSFRRRRCSQSSIPNGRKTVAVLPCAPIGFIHSKGRDAADIPSRR